MKVVGFKIFTSSRKFEKWQLENPLVTVHGIVPQYSTFEGDQNKDSMDFSLDYRVFVTYSHEVETTTMESIDE